MVNHSSHTYRCKFRWLVICRVPWRFSAHGTVGYLLCLYISIFISQCYIFLWHRRHFKMHFADGTFLYFYSNFTDISSQGTIHMHTEAPWCHQNAKFDSTSYFLFSWVIFCFRELFCSGNVSFYLVIFHFRELKFIWTCYVLFPRVILHLHAVYFIFVS